MLIQDQCILHTYVFFFFEVGSTKMGRPDPSSASIDTLSTPPHPPLPCPGPARVLFQSGTILASPRVISTQVQSECVCLARAQGCKIPGTFQKIPRFSRHPGCRIFRFPSHFLLIPEIFQPGFLENLDILGKLMDILQPYFTDKTTAFKPPHHSLTHSYSIQSVCKKIPIDWHHSQYLSPIQSLIFPLGYSHTCILIDLTLTWIHLIFIKSHKLALVITVG